MGSCVPCPLKYPMLDTSDEPIPQSKFDTVIFSVLSYSDLYSNLILSNQTAETTPIENPPYFDCKQDKQDGSYQNPASNCSRMQVCADLNLFEMTRKQAKTGMTDKTKHLLQA